MSGRRVSSTPSQAYDERPAVARGGGTSPDMQAAPAPARRSARGSLDDAMSASAADASGVMRPLLYRKCMSLVSLVMQAAPTPVRRIAGGSLDDALSASAADASGVVMP